MTQIAYYTERVKLLQLCRQRLDAFREQRGEEVTCLLMQKPAGWATGTQQGGKKE